MDETDTSKCPHGFAFAFGCHDCTRAYNAREQLRTELREREAAALAVLRDLVALADDEDGKRHADEWFARSNAVMDRARSLVAEHTTNEERET